MELYTEAWRVRTPMKKKDEPLSFLYRCKCKNEDKEKCNKKRGRKGREPSALSLATSLNDNCCVCIAACARYVRAIFKCVACFACCRLPVMEFEQILCEMIGATSGACRDIFCFIKKIFCACLKSKRK